MKRNGRGCWPSRLVCLLALRGCGSSTPGPEPEPTAATSPRWCDLLPRPANAALERVRVASDWFEVYRVAEGVLAIAEPLQFQEVISYLIQGTDRALLFDTGLGLVPIRPLIEELTRLPVEVLNSHSHFDHVGGNAEFDRILALDTAYTRANTQGFPHAALAREVAAASFCVGAPKGADTAGFRTRPWKPTRTVADRDTIDLGGRVLEILHVPGHTPDAVALLDRANGLLWTGDSYYDGTIWLYVTETNLDDYERSLARLAALTPGLVKLLPAHNTATAEPRRLLQAKQGIRQLRSGALAGTEEPDGRVVFAFDGFSILVSRPLLEGRSGDPSRGGSGLDGWR